MDIDMIKNLEKQNNKDYINLKANILFHSNRIEGSTFNLNEVMILLTDNIVEGVHHIEDVIETKNSGDLFDFTMETLGEPITHHFVCEMNQVLKYNTKLGLRGLTGKYKSIPNSVGGVEVAQPYQVQELMEDLLNHKVSTFHDIVKFHHDFEKIHPFIDGNGRVGRMLIIKQCIENNIVIPLINSDNRFNYYEALQTADSGDFSILNKLFEQFQIDMQNLDCYNQICNFFD